MTRTWVFQQSPLWVALERATFRSLAVAWVFFNALDAVITRAALTHGMASELNPIYQPLSLLQADALKLVATGVVLYLLSALRVRNAMLAMALLLTVVCWIGWVDLANLTVVGLR